MNTTQHTTTRTPRHNAIRLAIYRASLAQEGYEIELSNRCPRNCGYTLDEAASAFLSHDEYEAYLELQTRVERLELLDKRLRFRSVRGPVLLQVAA